MPYKIALVNMINGTVEGHKAGCRDLMRNRYRAEWSPWNFSVNSKHEAWLEYNADFIAEVPDGEAPESHCYPIDWKPCASDLPDR